jgi:hypothetical protein
MRNTAFKEQLKLVNAWFRKIESKDTCVKERKKGPISLRSVLKKAIGNSMRAHYISHMPCCRMVSIFLIPKLSTTKHIAVEVGVGRWQQQKWWENQTRSGGNFEKTTF